MRVAAVVALLLAMTACSGDDGGDSTDLLVLGATSLTEAFTEIETAFEAANPDVDVVLAFDSSSTLAGQVAEGAPAGVLATADGATMAVAVDSGEVAGEPQVFAENTAAIARPVGNETVTDPEDLEADGVVIAVCAPEVPCGVVARRLFDDLGIDPEIASEEENVGAVLTKLEADEIDAGVIYRTDVLASDAVEAIVLPAAVRVTTAYEIAAVEDSDAADAFVSFVTGPEGQHILGEFGFAAIGDQ